MAEQALLLSGLTRGEEFLIRANWEILNDKRWRCELCIRSTTEGQRAKKGCKGGATYTLDTFRVKGCIGNRYSPTVFWWWRVYTLTKHGILPEAGGIMDQAAKWLDIFALFGNLEAEHEEKERRSAQQAAKGSRRG